MNYFDPALTEDEIRGISAIGLAHMGDAVFEILVRSWLCAHGKATGKGLHQATIRLVCAESQAAKAEKILPLKVFLCPFRYRQGCVNTAANRMSALPLSLITNS